MSRLTIYIDKLSYNFVGIKGAQVIIKSAASHFQVMITALMKKTKCTY